MPNSPYSRVVRGWCFGCACFGVPLPLAQAATSELSSVEHAEASVEAARALAYEAQAAYEAGDYERAARTADAAQRLVQAPTLALLEARSLVHLDRWLEARRRYRAATQAPPGASDAFLRAGKRAAEELEDLERRLPHLLVRLAAPGTPPDDRRIRVDGVLFPAGSLGVWMPYDPGPHVVELQSGGYIERHEVDLAPSAREELHLGAVADEGGTPQAGSSSPVPWVAAAGGLALGGLGVGIGFGVHAANLHAELDAACPQGTCSPSDAGTLDDYRTARDISTAGYVVAGVAALTGAVVLIAWPSDRAERPLTALALGPGQVTLKGAF